MSEKLLITIPNNLTRTDKKKLEAIGYTVVIAKEPDKIKFGNDLSLIRWDEISIAALESISENHYDHAKLLFAKKILKEAIKNKTP